MRKIAAFILVLLLVAAVRLITWKSVFIGGEVMPYDTDPYYRLRQVQLIARHFPGPTPVDLYALGAEQSTDPTLARHEPWLHPVMFLTAWTLNGFGRDDAGLRRAAMFVPILWAFLTAAFAVAVGTLIADSFAGFMAAIFTAMCVPILGRTSLGALDNHMTEAAVFLAMLAVSGLIAKVPERPGKRYAFLAVLGVVLGACGLVSYWSALGVALLGGTYSLALACFSRGHDEAPLNARTVSLGTVLLIAAAMNLVFGNAFTALCMAGVGAYLLAQSFAWRAWPKFRLPAWLLAIAAGAAAVHLGAPGLEERLTATVRVSLHLFRDPDVTERFYANVNETGPIAWLQLHKDFSLFAWIAPVLLVLLGRQAWKERDFTKAAVGVMFVCLLGASIRNQRFANMAAGVMAPLVGWGLSGFAAACARTLSRGGEGRLAGGALKGAITVLMLVGFEPFVIHNAAVRADHAPYVPQALQETFRWMKARTPECPGFWHPVSPSPYRVMAVWDCGWWILDQAQRVPVANNAGEGAMASHEYFFGADPAESERIAAKNNARYVLTSPTGGRATVAFRVLGRLPGAGPSKAAKVEDEDAIIRTYRSTLHGQLQVFDGSAHTSDGVAFAALGTYRLLFETAAQSDTPMGRQVSAKLFERVPGARVEGTTTPGAAVAASIELESGAGRRLTYSDTSTADTQGKFALVLPYPTDAPSGDTKPLGKWKLTVAGEDRELEVPGEAVLEGRILSPGGAPIPGPAHA